MRQLLKPNAEQLCPFKELPILKDKPTLHCVFGLFSYYSQWISKFQDKIRHLVMDDSFPLNLGSVKAAKEEIVSALFQVIDENILLVVKTDVSDIDIVTTLIKPAFQ